MVTTAARIEEPDAAQLETWLNVTKGRVVLRRVGSLGQIRQEMVGSGKTVHLTPQERRMNQEVAANEDLDFFLNGTLQPVNLQESEDTAMFLDNPNLLGDDEQIRRLFKANIDVFAERLSIIKNSSALERLKDLAYQDETGATVAQARMIDARLAQVAPTIDNLHPDSPDANQVNGDRRIKAVTPK